MTARPHRSVWRKTATILFVAAAFVFIGYSVFGNLEELRAFEWEVRPFPLILSLAVLIGAFLWGVLIWREVMRRLGLPARWRPLCRIWFISNLGRYIPGKVWQFVGVAHLGRAEGLPALALVTGLAVQTGVTLVAAVLVLAVLAPEIGAGQGWSWLRWASPLLVLLVHPRPIRLGIRLVERTTGGSVGAWNARWRDGILLLALSVAGWLIMGVAFHLFASAVIPLDRSHLPLMIAVNAAAFAAGYLVFIAPAGLGAKEGAITALLSAIVPLPVAAVVAILTRLWTIAAEVLPATLLLPRERVRNRR